ncbi:MAG: TetR/AcrR family transcriptional regulator [Bacteroidales bacterium]|nr:TetR/AcrR family transcriptional regulator [Bacteroidales bacterium]
MESISDIKLRQITLAARDLFWKYGYRKVTIEEVCRKAGVSKMTFYKHFANKTGLVKFLLSFVIEEGIKKFKAIMESDIPFTEKVLKQIEMKKEGIHGMSDLFLEDWLSSDDPELVAYRTELTGSTTKQIMSFYKDAQKKGEIRKDIKPEFILYFINHMSVILEDRSLQGLYNTMEDLVIELMNFFFYGISERK